MNEEQQQNQTTETEEHTDQSVEDTEQTESIEQELDQSEVTTDGQEIIFPEVETHTTEYTTFETTQGNIEVVHQITLGDLLISTFLFGILILMLISQVIKRG